MDFATNHTEANNWATAWPAPDHDAHNQLICPPVVYIHVDHKESGENILKMLCEAEVQNTRGLTYTFINGICSKCATKFQVIQHESREAIPISLCNEELDEHRIKHCHPVIQCSP